MSSLSGFLSLIAEEQMRKRNALPTGSIEGEAKGLNTSQVKTRISSWHGKRSEDKKDDNINKKSTFQVRVIGPGDRANG